MTTNPASDKPLPQRTEQQNKALHVYFTLVADALNDAGLDMRKVLKPEVEIPWSAEAVKEYLWRPIMRIQLQKISTTEMNTKDIDLVYDTMNRHLAAHGIHEPFPSIDEIIFKQTYGKTKSIKGRARSV